MLAYPSFFILLLLLDQMFHIDIVDSYSFVPRRKYGFFFTLRIYPAMCADRASRTYYKRIVETKGIGGPFPGNIQIMYRMTCIEPYTKDFHVFVKIACTREREREMKK